MWGAPMSKMVKMLPKSYNIPRLLGNAAKPGLPGPRAPQFPDNSIRNSKIGQADPPRKFARKYHAFFLAPRHAIL